jgi:N4-gp56 family major capsid protein
MGSAYQFDLTDPETIQKWERELHVQVALRTPLMSKKYGFIGDSDSALVQKKTKVWDPDGTQATVTLVRELQGEATFGNQTLRTREEAPNTATFKWQINQVRHAVTMQGRINKRRVTWDIWKQSQRGLGTWFAKVTEASAMLHGAGVPYDVSTAQEWYHKGTKLGHTFSNTPRTPDTKHIMRIGHSSDTDDSGVGLDPAAIVDLDTISELKARAKNLPIPIRPAMVHGQELYVFFAHSYALRHMKDNSKWMAMMKAAMNERTVADHPFWTGSLGVWDEVLIVEDNYIPPGLDSTNARVANARRNIFAGAQAFVFGVAKEYDNDNMYLLDEENWDYNNNKGIGATTLGGIACPYYSVVEQGTTEDYGKIVCTSYAQELVTSA